MSGERPLWARARRDAGTATEHTAVRRAARRAPPPPVVKRVLPPTPITLPGKVQRDMPENKGKQMAKDVRAGDRVDSHFSVAYKKPVVEYRHGHMFEFRAVDRSGRLTVKYWGDEDRASVEKVHASFETNDVVRVYGEASEYRNQVEVSVSKKNGGTVTRMEDGTYDASDFVPALDDLPGRRERLLGYIDRIEEPNMRSLVRSFFEDPAFIEEFASAPASIGLHSAVVGGLMQHTINVCEMALGIVRLHPELDRDLVLTGALLHDVGKVRCYRVTTHIDHTPEGNLLGHIVIGDEELMARVMAIPGFPEGTAMKLRHVLLSHFGRREWGSPVEPMTPEALAVHMADDADAKVEYMIGRRRDAATDDDWVWDARLNRLIYIR